MRALTSSAGVASFRLQRSCQAVVQQLEKRWMLSADDPDLWASEGTLGAAAVSAALDPQSDSGLSSSDGITSDNTPVLQVSAPQYAAGTIWAVASNQNGFTYIELDPTTGAATGRQFTNAWGNWQWACGSAVGDGRLYVAAPAPGTSGPTDLRTYDLASLSLISTIRLSGTNLPGGLAYMNGKLYVADSAGFQVVDPTTGAVLETKVVLRSDWSWSGTAQSLAASPTENALYAVNWFGALTKIDAATGTVLAEYAAFSSAGGVTGAAYSQGKLFVSEGNLLHTFDPATLQRVSSTALPSGAWMFVSLAGDGATKTLLRLYDNGTQIGSNYSPDASSIVSPTLYDGPHDLVVKAYGPSGTLLGSSAPVRVVVDTRLPTVSPSVTLAIGSDTGISSTDGITSDTTPLLNVIPGSEGTIWTISTTPTDGFIFTEVDTIAPSLLRGFTDPSLADYTAGFGAALGDGVLYVTTVKNQEYRLRTYTLTGALQNDVPLGNMVFGLAYLNGKLYGASGDLLEINPQTGATISRRMIYYPGGAWVGVGYNLAADSKAGVLYTTIDQRLVKIDPASSVPLSVTNLVNAPAYFDGLAFSVGKLIGSKLDGQLYYIDPSTAQVTSFRQLPQSLRVVYGMAGEGNDTPLYYRVFCDGVQVSGDYESTAQFQLPELSAGTHTLTITSVDAAGNVSPSVARIVHIDATAPAQPGAPSVDPASDTGLSSTDGITADATPLLTIRQMEDVSSIWQVSSLADGLLFVERDPATGAEISRFRDTTVQGWTWAVGAATGDGVIYVAGADGALRSLRTYSLSTRTLISNVPLEKGVFGLAYLDGRLYGADAGLMEIDPTTGAILSSQNVFVPGGQWVGTGAGLAADSVEGVLYSVTFSGQLVKIDPATASTLAVIDNVDPQRQINGLAFAGGSLVGITYQGKLLSIDPHTGQVTQIAQLSTDNGYYHGLAGDGAPGSWPYFRVFSDGVQVSGDYETGEEFQMPQLPAGTHSITVAYVDLAGNVSAMSEPITLVIDTTAPQRPDSASLDSTSDTGVSASDGITSDTTPLLNVTVGEDGASIWAVSSEYGALRFIELNAQTGAEISRFSDTSVQSWNWGLGAALGEGVIYVAGTSGDLFGLRTYRLETRSLIRSVPISEPIYGLAYLDAKLYASNWNLMQIDPLTGQVLERRSIALPGGQWIGTGASLTADNDEGVLYSITWGGQLVTIDPASSVPLSVINGVAGQELIQGLAYADGALIATTGNGKLLQIDTLSGQVTTIAQLPPEAGFIAALAGEGSGVAPYYRVFADGVQISGDYESAGQFQMPELSAGTHVIAIQYVDSAGNTSHLSAPTTISILSSPPAQPAVPTLDPSSDGGALGDHLTSDSTPLIQIPLLDSDIYYRVFADGAQVSGDYEQGGSFVMPQLADGQHLITIAYVDAAGNVSAMSDALALRIDTTAPVVQEVVINDGSAQRSMVNQITVVFSEVVNVAADAISLTLVDGSAIPGTVVTSTNASGDGRTYVLTFSGEGVVAGSLADGLYALRVGSGVMDVAGNVLAPDFIFGFHRLFGDAAGDGSISGEDLQRFVDSLSSRNVDLADVWFFDYDASGRVTGADMSEFIERYVAAIQA